MSNRNPSLAELCLLLRDGLEDVENTVQIHDDALTELREELSELGRCLSAVCWRLDRLSSRISKLEEKW